MINPNAIRVNHDQTIRTEAGEFMAVQRNSGYADNDGAWVITQLPELYWSHIGTLRQRRPGAFVGVFATIEEAEAAIRSARLQPEQDENVNSMGRVSC